MTARIIALFLILLLSLVALASAADYKDPSVCRGCHTEIYAQWNGSMHSNSYNDPVFQKLYKMASEDTNGATDSFCARCHIPIGVLKGENPSNLSEISKKGIQCDFCHTVKASTGIGNGAYMSSPDNTKRGPFNDSTSPYHKTAYSELHTRSEFCGMCHDVTNPFNDKPIERTYTEWKESPYNTGDPKTSVHCQDCHMRQKPGLASTGATDRPNIPGRAAIGGPQRDHIFTHYFVGGNALLPGILGSAEHDQLAVERLKSAARVEIITPEKLRAGNLGWVKVKVTNTGAGHKLPTGLTEAREMWLDLSIQDASGREVYRSGALRADGNVDPDAVIYRTVLGDDRGNPTLKVWEATHVVSDTRIPPRGYSLENYTFPVPANVKSPLTVKAILYYHTASQSLVDMLFGKGAIDVPEIEMASATARVNVETPKAKSPGFEVMAAVMALAALYLFRRKTK